MTVMDDWPIHILFVQGDPMDAFPVEAYLEEVRPAEFVLTQTSGFVVTLQSLNAKHFDVLLLGIGLSDRDWLETLVKVQREHPTIPIVILSDQDDEALAVQSIKAGAQDFVVKGQFASKTLWRVLRLAIERRRCQQRLMASEVGYRRFFETSLDGIFLLDATTGQIIDANPFIEELLGYRIAELIGKRLWETAPFHNTSANKVALRTVQEKRYFQHEDLPLARRDGTFVHVEFVSNVYSSSNEYIIYCNIRDITVRRQTEAAEREAQRFKQATLDALASHIAVLDDAGTIIAVNQAWNQFLKENGGDATTCAIGANYLQICEEARGPWSEEALAMAEGIRAVMSGQLNDFSLEYPCHSPHIERWFSVCVTRFAGEGALHVVVAHENITKRRQAEESLKSSEANLAKSQQLAHLGSWELDVSNQDDFNANPLRWSDEVFRILGRIPREFEPTYETFFQMVHLDDRSRLRHVLSDAIRERTGYSVDYRVVLPDGRERIFHGDGEFILNEDCGQPSKLVGLVQDITERTQAESLLVESQQRLALATEAAQVGIWDWDLTSGKLVWDACMCELYGINPQRFDGGYGTWQDSLHPQDRDRVEAELVAAVYGSNDFHSQFRVTWPAGELRYIEAHAVVQRAPDGTALRMVGANRDFTERHRLEQQVIHTSKLAALGELVAGVAHEINNPLAAISGYAQLLETYPDSAVQEDARTIDSMVQRASRIVRALRSYACPSEAKNRTLLDLNSVVSSALDVVVHTLRRADITLTLDLASDLPQVPMNFGEIEQVVVNLLSNAVHAVRDSPVESRVVNITTRFSPQGIGGAAGASNLCVLEIEDSGIGIPQALQSRIFDPFFTTKDTGEGTGLGLYISHGIITAHGGTIDVVSKLGEGTTFTVALPIE